MTQQRELRLQSTEELLEQFDRLVLPLGLARREVAVLRVIAAQGRFCWHREQRASWLALAAEKAAAAAGCSQHTWEKGAADLERRGVLQVLREGRPWTYLVNWSRVEMLEPPPPPVALATIFADQHPSAPFSTLQHPSAVFSTLQQSSAVFSTLQQSSAPHQQSPQCPPLACAGAPFVRSSSSLDPKTTTNVVEPERAELASLCVEAYAILRPDSKGHAPKGKGDDYDVAAIKTLAWLALEFYGRHWLLAALRDAARRSPGKLDYAKGTAANQTGDRDLFFARFDERIRVIRSPPPEAAASTTEGTKNTEGRNE